MISVMKYVLYLAVLIVLAIPLGKLYKKSNGRRKDFSQPDSATM